MKTTHIIALFATMFVVGCAHLPSVISVTAPTDHITAIQGDLSAVDGKAIVIESYLKSHQ